MVESSGGAKNTLVEGPASAEDATSVYDALNRSAETNLLVVSYRRDPDAWFRDWRSRVGPLPSEVAFVSVGETTRSVAADGGGPVGGTPPVVDAVAEPADLTGLGIRVSEYFKAWNGNGRQTVVWFDSLTTLLQFVDLDRAYRFLHVLGGRVKSVGGRGYYLLDPAAHDDRSLAIVRELLDDAVDIDDLRAD